MRSYLSVVLAVAIGLLGAPAFLRADEKEEEPEPPHGGALLEIGEHVAHIELVHEPDKGRVVLYILDAKVEKPVAIKDAPKLNLMTADGAKQVLSKAVEPDKDGMASQFEANDDLLKADPLKGRIAVVFDGKKYNVEIKEAEGEHEHK